MSPLLSTSQLQGLQSLVEDGMVDQVEILRRSVTDDAYSDDGTETFASQGTVKAWIRHVPAGVQEVVGGVVGNVSDLRVLVPVGTDIRNNDRLVIPTTSGPETVVVEDTNLESTYKTHTWINVRHLD